MQAARPERTIEDWRADIDNIDAQLVALLNRRAECAVGIGQIKRRDPEFLEWLMRAPAGRVYRAEIEAMLRR